MRNRTPIAGADRPALPDFAPVPRKYRHDGWTPERQKAFIEALADTGCVSRAAGIVNMAQANCYTLRRARGAEEFRRAWDAALDFGLQRLKDIAFERAIEGQQIPVFVGGKLMGYRRKTNDALLMFCLRHYGQDANGKRTTINYFSSRAEAGTGAASGGDAAGAVAQASTTTVRTVISGRDADAGGTAGPARDDALAEALDGFAGVALDTAAMAAIQAALIDCAARRRAADLVIEEGGDDGIAQQLAGSGTVFVRVYDSDHPYWATLEPPFDDDEEYIPSANGEVPWDMAGADEPYVIPTWDDIDGASA